MASIADRLLQALSYLCVAAIVVLSLLPAAARPHTGAPGQGEHVVAYFLTALLFGLRARSWRDLARCAAVLAAGAGLLELAQLWVPGRQSQFGDFVASTSGILIGLAAGAALAPVYRRILARLAN